MDPCSQKYKYAQKVLVPAQLLSLRNTAIRMEINEDIDFKFSNKNINMN